MFGNIDKYIQSHETETEVKRFLLNLEYLEKVAEDEYIYSSLAFSPQANIPTERPPLVSEI
jgi:hypothetical protein